MDGDADPWGRALLARVRSEAQALLGEGWEPLEDAPLFANLPAVWPVAHRCWLPPGRLWLLRSPWPTIGLQVVLQLIGRRVGELGVDVDAEGFTTAAPGLLALSEDEVWAWWAPDPDHPARQWLARGQMGRPAARLVASGLSPADVDLLAAPLPDGAGLSVDQALDWCDTVGRWGPDAVPRILAWRRGGQPADPPGISPLMTQDPDPYAPWFAAGFTATEIEAVSFAELATALAWRQAGFDVATTGTLLIADRTLTPAEAKAFKSARISPADRIRWVEAGFTAAEARAWTARDVRPNEARVWRSVGLTPADVVGRPPSGGGPFLPPDVSVGWIGSISDRSTLYFGVTDPPGTRGRLATDQVHHRRAR